MEKYKVCPYCGKHNIPKMLECVQCETDLSNVPVVDEEIEGRNKEQETEENVQIRMVRICDCGFHNIANARKCNNCGEDLSDIIPSQEDEVEQEKCRFVLASLDGEFAFQVVESKVLVGREAEMQEYLAQKLYVSRQHAELLVEDNKLFIRNISKTNYTYVNNTKIPQEKFELHDGDEIGLGGNSVNGSRQQDAAYFLVRIELCI